MLLLFTQGIFTGKSKWRIYRKSTKKLNEREEDEYKAKRHPQEFVTLFDFHNVFKFYEMYNYFGLIK